MNLKFQHQNYTVLYKNGILLISNPKEKIINIEINLPIKKDDLTYTLSRNLYANSIYAFPKLPDTYAFINNLDNINDTSIPNMGIGFSYKDSVNTILMELVENFEDSILLDLDTWYYFRASTIIELAIIRIVINALNIKINTGILPTKIIKKGILSLFNLFHYIGPEETVKPYLITENAYTVRIPNILSSIENIQKDLNTSFADLSNCSQSSTMDSFSLKAGIELENGKCIIKDRNDYNFGFSKVKMDKGLLLNKYIDGKRRIVSRSTIHSMDLLTPDKPITFDSYHTPMLPSVNALVARAFDIKTLNDSCIINQNFLNRLNAYKYFVQRIKINKNSEIEYLVKQSNNIDNDLSKLFNFISTKKNHFKNSNLSKEEAKALIDIFDIRKNNPQFVRRNQAILKEKITIDSENSKTVTHRAKLKTISGCVVSSINIEEESDYRIITLVYKCILKAKLGEKLADQTGHKYTIGYIHSPETMPTYEGTPIDLIVPFEIQKRNTPAVLVEEALSLLHLKDIHPIIIDKPVKEILNLCAEYKIQKTVTYNDKQIPIGYRRIYRIDKAPETILKYIDNNPAYLEDGVRISYNVLLSFYTRNCNGLIDWITKHGKNHPTINAAYLDILDCIYGNFPEAINSISIYNNIPQAEQLNTAKNLKEYGNLLNNTPLDQRLKEHSIGYFTTILNEQEIKFRIPKFSLNIYFTETGNAIINNLTKTIDSIITFTKLYNKELLDSNKDIYRKLLNEAIENYQSLLFKTLGDIVNTINNPRVPYSLYGTIKSDNSLKIGQVGIPSYIYDNLIKNNKVFSAAAKKLAIFFRQPVHDENEVFSMEVIPVYSNCIHINPLIASLVRGDFDGDASMLVIPDEINAYNDLVEKLSIDKILDQDKYWKHKNFFHKVMENYDIEFTNLNRKWEKEFYMFNNLEVKGLSSLDYENPNQEFTYLLENTEIDITRNSIISAWQMSNIKVSTAYAGAFSLAFISWLINKYKSPDKVKLGMEMYRFIAEDSLKGNKSGNGGNASRKLIQFFFSGATSMVNQEKIVDLDTILLNLNLLILSEEANPSDYKELGLLVHEFISERSTYSSLQEFQKSISPIHAINRNILDKEVIAKFLENSNKPFVLDYI